jgi:hypothetical protein
MKISWKLQKIGEDKLEIAKIGEDKLEIAKYRRR